MPTSRSTTTSAIQIILATNAENTLGHHFKWSWSEWGTIVTAIGTTMSIWAVCAIRGLKRIFAARQRLPQLQRRLKDKLDSISGHLNAYQQNKDAFHITIQEVRAVVTSYSDKTLSKQTKKSLKEVKSRCDEISYATTHAQAFDLYSALRGIEEALHNEIKDLNHTN